jgi:hypothetical protein
LPPRASEFSRFPICAQADGHLQRSTCRYASTKTDEPKLVARLREVAAEDRFEGLRGECAVLALGEGLVEGGTARSLSRIERWLFLRKHTHLY